MSLSLSPAECFSLMLDERGDPDPTRRERKIQETHDVQTIDCAARRHERRKSTAIGTATSLP